MASDEGYHVPVLLAETVENLVTDPNGVYVDGTFGGGGHSKAIFEKLGAHGRLISIDRDPDALANSAQWARERSDRVTLVRGNFGNLPNLLAELEVGPVSGILLDLGVSSHQIDEAQRGFSFMKDGPLDMRMDPERGVPASELVNKLSEVELSRVFRDFGEEPRHRRAANAVAVRRATSAIMTTGELAQTLEEALGRRGKKHPGTKVFQALRIAVNGELDELRSFLDGFSDLLRPGGRVAIISYHSLEDRMVKRAFRDLEPRCRCPREQPVCTCGEPGNLRSIARRAIKPSRGEIGRNSRARSARLRVAEKFVDESNRGEIV